MDHIQAIYGDAYLQIFAECVAEQISVNEGELEFIGTEEEVAKWFEDTLNEEDVQMTCTMDVIGKIFAFNMPVDKSDSRYRHITKLGFPRLYDLLRKEIPCIREIDIKVQGFYMITVDTSDPDYGYISDEDLCKRINDLINKNGGWI